MAEVRVADFGRSLRWYQDTLGLSAVLLDEPNRFALLEAGATGVALKEGNGFEPGSNVRLLFVVEDLDGEHERLSALGVGPGPIRENPSEMYREFRVSDPDGTPVTLFAWSHGRVVNGS
jgi:hypothetical protein